MNQLTAFSSDFYDTPASDFAIALYTSENQSTDYASDFTNEFYEAPSYEANDTLAPFEIIRRSFEKFRNDYNGIRDLYIDLIKLNKMPIVEHSVDPNGRTIEKIIYVSDMIRNLLHYELLIDGQTDLSVKKTESADQHLDKLLIYARSKSETSEMIYIMTNSLNNLRIWDIELTNKYGFLTI